MTVDLAGATLATFLESVQDAAAVNLAASRPAHVVAGRFDVRAVDEPAAGLLDRVLDERGLRGEVRGNVVRITDEGGGLEPPLPERRASLDVRGVTVPELIATLRGEGVPAVASVDAWSGGGTVSVTARDLTLAGIAAAIASQTSLRVDVAERREPQREAVLYVSGRAWSVAEAFAAKAPSGFAGVAVELEELERDLGVAVAARALARADASLAMTALVEKERAVTEAAIRIARRVRRAQAVARAPETLAELAPRIEELERRVAAASVRLEAVEKAPARDETACHRARNEMMKLQVQLERAGGRSALAALVKDVALRERLLRGERMP